MKEIKVSVIIPVYNAEDTVGRCVESILSQTLAETEIICVDDGSTDGSAQVLKSLCASDSRISVITRKNSHAGVARNVGLAAAKGKYVTFMDADDVYFSAEVLKKLYGSAEKHAADMVKGRFCYMDNSSGKISSDDFSRNSSVGFFLMANPVFRRRPERFIHAADVPWNGIYRRDFLLENGIEFNDLICVNDHSFYINCLLKARKLRFVRTKTVLYTTNREGSLVSSKPSHFSSQIDSYNIVDGICCKEPENIRRAIMRQELIGVFSLFIRLEDSSREELRGSFSDFLRTVDEEILGTEFLQSFEWAEQYSMLRYGVSSRRKRRSIFQRTADCIREHGVAYTLRRVLRR